MGSRVGGRGGGAWASAGPVQGGLYSVPDDIDLEVLKEAQAIDRDLGV